MKKKLFIIIPVVVLLLFVVIMVFSIKHKSNERNDTPANLYITYRENGTDYACFTFYDNGNYSLYDCDSEPTSYPFDSEWECKYTYNRKINSMEFTCPDDKEYKINIINWDEVEFSFEYDGVKKTFIAIEKNDQ